MPRTEKRSLKSCLVKLCGLKRSSHGDYECLPYKRGEAPRKNTRLNHPNHLNGLSTNQSILIGEFFRQVEITSRPMPTAVVASKEPASGAYSNPDYETLPISCESSQCSSEGSCDEASDFQPLYATIEQDSGIYVCQSPYAAEFDGDINLKYTERVEVLHATEDFTLVKKINGSGETGYVSTKCVTSLEEFMKRF